LEREEHKASIERYSFGGVRTFPLIGLLGYSLALLSGPQLLPLTLGLAVVGAFLLLSYRHKLATDDTAGVTTEMSGLTTYVVGALVYHEQFWIATTLSVASMLLLELKAVLESLTKRIASDEILTFTKFLVLTAVILPVVPNQEIGPFQINPFKTWLVVVAVPDPDSGAVKREYEPKNPLEMRAAFLFALLFVAMLVATRLAAVYLGKAGVYSLAAIMGIADVDPFLMGMTQSAGTVTPLSVAASGILIAAASNNTAKGLYAYMLADHRTGIQSLCLLVALALLGLTPLVWLAP
jgi:uncharacterized membrane protein (DUF4010 family)